MPFQFLNGSSFKSWGLRPASFNHTSISIKYSASSALRRVGLQGPGPTRLLNDIYFSIVGVSWRVEWTGQGGVLAINHCWQRGRPSVYLAAAWLAAKTKSCNCITTTCNSCTTSGGARQGYNLASLTCRLLD